MKKIQLQSVTQKLSGIAKKSKRKTLEKRANICISTTDMARGAVHKTLDREATLHSARKLLTEQPQKV